MKEFSAFRSAILVAIGLLLAGSPSRRLAAGAEPATASKHLFPFRQSGPDGKWGYMDRQGKTVIGPRFDSAEAFSEGLGHVVWGDREGFINARGEFAFTLPKEYRVFDRFSEGLVRFVHEGKYGFLDTRGRVIVEPRYDDAREFAGGLAWVNVGAKLSDCIPLRRRGGKWGAVDRNGELAFRPKYLAAGDFSDGLGLVVLDSAFAFVDRWGELVLTVDFSRNRVSSVNSFSEGLAAVSVTGFGVGYIDTKGRWVIPPQFTVPGHFSGGLAPAGNGKKMGYIDRNGRFVIGPRFDEARAFCDGRAAVRLQKRWAFIDRSGELVIGPEPHRGWPGPANAATDFEGGLARVHIGGTIDPYRRPPRWTGGAWYYVDRDGQIVRRFRYDEAGATVAAESER